MEPTCMGSKRVGDMVGGRGVECFFLCNFEKKEDDVGKRKVVPCQKAGYI